MTSLSEALNFSEDFTTELFPVTKISVLLLFTKQFYKPCKDDELNESDRCNCKDGNIQVAERSYYYYYYYCYSALQCPALRSDSNMCCSL